ncbi:hypothetical protein CK203_022724 [Vitis vinifera]|uniref:DUF4283 domain-containing protein n=1 Tax=Vitis vinifera TaxID=29760 RepID=A0A438IX05_VITVI|nr:hypothetical protein CK203_022724 [Vitis vinifera]
MGLASVGSFLEGLHQCIEDVKEGRWEKGWKEMGRSFSLGRGDKGGWLAMVEALRKLDSSFDKRSNNKKRGYWEDRLRIRDAKGRTWKVWVGKWKSPGVERQDGFGKLGKGRALLELEFVEEARRVLISGDLYPTLWWEAMLSLRQEAGRKRGLWSRPSGEIRGDADACAGLRVEEMACAGFEEQRKSVDGIGRLAQEVGSDAMGFQAQVEGEASKGVMFGHRIPGARACPPVIIGHSKGGNLELEFVRLREEEIGRRQQPDLHHSMADRVLEEEAARYGLVMNLGGLRAQGSSSSNFFYFGRTPEREFYDYFWGAKGGHSGRKGGEKLRSGRFLDWRVLNAMGSAGGVLICWDKRSLEILDWEEGQFSISCRFRNVGDGGIWVFTGVYGPFSKKKGSACGRRLGQLEDCGRSLGV